MSETKKPMTAYRAEILAQEAETDTRILRLLIAGLEEMNPGDAGITVRELLGWVEQSPKSFHELRRALDWVAPAEAVKGKGSRARSVGRNLQKFSGRVLDGKCISRASVTADGTGRWTVVTGGPGSEPVRSKQ